MTGFRSPAIHEGVPPADVATIHDAIRRDIVLLRMLPGQRLSENSLAERFGTSRTPVRAALIHLVEEGLIDVRPQRGTFVSRISMKAVERARFVRRALEIAIIRKAALDGMPMDCIAAIRESLIRQEALSRRLAEGADPRSVAESFTLADDDFHRGFARGIGLEDIWQVIEREKAQFDRIRFLSLPQATPIDVLIGQHRAMLDAVVKGDLPAAVAAVCAHMNEVLKVAKKLAERNRDLFAKET